MFNVTVINAKKSYTQIFTLITIIILLFCITRIVTKFRTAKILQINISGKLIQCLNIELPAVGNTYYYANNTLKEDNEEDEKSFFVGMILEKELSKIQEIKNNYIAEDNQNISNNKTNTDDNEILQVVTNVETQIVTQNLIAESYNVNVNGVKIKNETSYDINEEMLKNTLDINKENILIFHTHTCESYTPSEKFQYEQTGNYRTTDLNFSVARVGTELERYLKSYGFNVYHDMTYHDYPAYSGSYTRSMNTVQNILKENNSDIIIDLHRDAIGSKSEYDPSVKIGEDVVAQLMFVIGTNGGGLYHPNWESNLSFAVELQKKANEMYPGLFKPIILRNSRYNQNLGKAACIIEVGATGNTLEQCLNSMKYLSKVLDEIKKD